MIVSEVLRARARMARNRLFRPRGGVHPGGLLTLVGIVFIGGFMCLSLGAMFVELNSMGMGIERAGTALALVFAAAAAGLLVFDLHYAVAALLFDSDLSLLMRSPLTPGQMLLIKLLDSLPRTTAMVLVLALPAAVAFSWSHPLPPWGWLLLPIQLGALWAIPLGLGMCGALAMIRVVPARRARDMLALLSTVVVLVLWLLNAFVLPRALETDAATADHLASVLAPHGAAWISPPHWAGAALVAAADGAPARAAGWTGLLILGSLASFGLAAWVTRRHLDEALARVSVDPRLVRGAPRVTATSAFTSGWRPLLLKDARLLVRDWTVMGDVLIGALLWTLLPLVFRSFQEFEPRILMRAMLVTLTIGLGFEVGTRMVPFERMGLAWSRLAPVSLLRWNLIKLGGGLLLSMPFLVVVSVTLGVALDSPPAQVLESFGAGLSSLVLALSAGLWVGWQFGDPGWTNPRGMLSLGGRLLSGVLLTVMAATWFLALGVADGWRTRLPPGALMWAPLLLSITLAAPVVWLAVRHAAHFEWKR